MFAKYSMEEYYQQLKNQVLIILSWEQDLNSLHLVNKCLWLNSMETKQIQLLT